MRDLVTAVICGQRPSRTVRELRPKAFLFENVRGLLRPAFTDYLHWIEANLRAPQLEIQPDESLAEHSKRLQTAVDDHLYDVKILRVNAADYGAPQKRNRVLIAGIRKDLKVALASSESDPFSRPSSLGSMDNRRILATTRNSEATLGACFRV